MSAAQRRITLTQASDGWWTAREEREEYQFTKGDLRNFDPGEAVICRQGKGWVHGRIKMLEE